MENIYSEEELVYNKELAWGQWKFSLSEDQINRKINSFPIRKQDSVKNDHWQKLFSAVIKKSTPQTPDDEKMDCSTSYVDDNHELCDVLPEDIQENHEDVKDSIDNTSMEDLSSRLTNLCNQLAPRLRNDMNSVREEMFNLNKDIEQLNERDLELVLENAWSHLNADSSKLCFCIPFCSNQFMCEKLCKLILCPWLRRNLPTQINQLSVILSVAADTVCQHLIVPLLKEEDSPLLEDVNLDELMTSFSKKHWTTLMQALLKDLTELQEWQIPVLVNIVQHAELDTEVLCRLMQLMSSVGIYLAENRDFGALLVAVASCVSVDSSGIVPQLKLVANNYKGPLKVKALKILNECVNL